ncbi:MAG: cadherin repeat domain-containing protein, partial [Acidovorax sp.]|uniref:cadherin repeat domain-containing protein n=1 Tax=Acidovorax sp. TaxID=1872122 RepID=UPI00391947AC
DNGAPSLSDEAVVTVQLRHVNKAPVVPGGQVREVEENSPAGTLVGVQVFAWDPDAGDVMTFSIVGGDGAGIFSIHPATAQIRVAQAVLDFEVQRSFTLLVRVTDDGEPTLHTDQNVTVRLSEVEVFRVESLTGQVEVRRAVLHCEVLSRYTLTVRVTDDGVPPLSDSGVVSVSVLDVNEPPVLVLQRARAERGGHGGGPAPGGVGPRERHHRHDGRGGHAQRRQHLWRERAAPTDRADRGAELRCGAAV